MIDFTAIDYLKNGNDRQKRAYELLSKHLILEKLKEYSPVLAGTIPIEIDIEESDLDVICEVKDKAEFKRLLTDVFSEFNIHIEELVINGREVITGNFTVEEFPVEIFGQDQPVTEQNAYRHMIAEYRILQERGEDFKQEIIALKKQGFKTEPAFGQLLGLENPYEYLLKL
ncbi:hypothetical protein QE422_003440 [Chryseobacterium sp. SORGH_AS 447]|uniref:DUF4269 domain-containing protein n=1 Tax=Chryseobacterium sp. SORGH_AS_0447 TaxID=3041769 RepID=UPI00278590EC|nr:DUF4269 domain-containing protein [Chryseobacterium sp. SORGH_AS_0447]MDQ1163072.1 hypothetical protein [Chryseobacterium sp. SORGH_AS_0447]